MTENIRRLPFPEAGEDAFVEFDLDALLALEEQLGADYYSKVQEALAGFNIATLQKLAAIGLHDGLMKTALKKVSLREFAEKMGDGLAAFTHGITLQELRETRRDEMAAMMMRAKIAEIIAAREVTLAGVSLAENKPLEGSGERVEPSFDDAEPAGDDSEPA